MWEYKIKTIEKFSYDDCFDLAKQISTYMNSSDKDIQQKGRELLIKTLEVKEKLHPASMDIFDSLILAAGFYPYINKASVELIDFGEQFRAAFHKSEHLDDKYFHAEQKKLYDLLKEKRNVIVSAPTSFGKSMLIEEIVASKIYNNIVIIQPTLALLDETRKKLRKYSSDYKIIVKTTQECSTTKGNIFLLTGERVLEYPNLPPIDLLVLDEFYKLSTERGDNRSNVLNNAFLKVMQNKDCRFYMLGPNIDKIPEGFQKKYNAEFFITRYSMVVTEEIDKTSEAKIKTKTKKIDEEDLFKTLDALDDQTLVFCSSPQTARRLAFGYKNHIKSTNKISPVELPLCAWIRENISYPWSLSECLSYGIAVHDGSMPKNITTSTIQYFNDKKLQYLFCTNTIIEGVNTSAKYVVYYDDKIGPNDVDYFDYSNIKGRAGRLMEHYVGQVINLKKPPEKKEMMVDFPFFEQNPIDTEVLINIAEKEVIDVSDNIKRYSDFYKKDPELQKILKQNAVSIEGQEKILNKLFNDFENSEKRKNIVWNRIDNELYDNLKYVFDLCWDNLLTEHEKRSVGSQGKVVYFINSICKRKSIPDLIQQEVSFGLNKWVKDEKLNIQNPSVAKLRKIDNTKTQEIIDKSIETVFSLHKNWAKYRAPKWLNVVDSLQKYVAEKLGFEAGDYSYVAEMIENEFIQSGLKILLEYGVPSGTIEKIQIFLKARNLMPSDLSEDDAINLVEEKLHLIKSCLSRYEYEYLISVI